MSPSNQILIRIVILRVQSTRSNSKLWKEILQDFSFFEQTTIMHRNWKPEKGKRERIFIPFCIYLHNPVRKTYRIKYPLCVVSYPKFSIFIVRCVGNFPFLKTMYACKKEESYLRIMEKPAERFRVPNIKKVDTYNIIEEVFPERNSLFPLDMEGRGFILGCATLWVYIDRAKQSLVLPQVFIYVYFDSHFAHLAHPVFVLPASRYPLYSSRRWIFRTYIQSHLNRM